MGLAFLPMFLRGLGLLPSLIQGVEGLFGAKTGVDKRQAALDILAASINVVNAVEDRQILDAPGFTLGLGQIVDGVVQCLNASLWHKA